MDLIHGKMRGYSNEAHLNLKPLKRSTADVYSAHWCSDALTARKGEGLTYIFSLWMEAASWVRERRGQRRNGRKCGKKAQADGEAAAVGCCDWDCTALFKNRRSLWMLPWGTWYACGDEEKVVWKWVERRREANRKTGHQHGSPHYGVIPIWPHNALEWHLNMDGNDALWLLKCLNMCSSADSRIGLVIQIICLTWYCISCKRVTEKWPATLLVSVSSCAILFNTFLGIYRIIFNFVKLWHWNWQKLLFWYRT